MSNLQPIYGREPRLWHLTRGDGAGGIEEVVALIQGIICKKDMPPFGERVRYIILMVSLHLFHLPALSPASKHIRHLRQGVSITGLGLEDFQNQLNMIPDIAALFTRAVSEDKIQPNTIIGDLEDFSTLNASNRYFTPRKDAQMAKELTFHQDVDPYGHLTRLLGSAHMHIEENTVSYYERVCSGDTKYAASL